MQVTQIFVAGLFGNIGYWKSKYLGYQKCNKIPKGHMKYLFNYFLIAYLCFLLYCIVALRKMLWYS